MFNRILVPVDLGSGHESAVDLAVKLLRPGSGHLTLVHAIEVVPGMLRDEAVDFYARLEQAARQHLEHYMKRKGAAHIATQLVVYGDRGGEILRLAEESGADLIVLRSHRIDPCDPSAGWAALSHKIAALAPCPVLLVKSPKPRLQSD